MSLRFNDRADGCFASAGDRESDIGVTEREEFEELIAVLLRRLGDETVEEPCNPR